MSECDRCGQRPFGSAGLSSAGGTRALVRRRDKTLCMPCADKVDEVGYERVFSNQSELSEVGQ